MILVTGGTGFIGEQLVRALLSREEPVRLLVRNPDKAAAIYGPLLERLERVVGDLADPLSLERAVAGVEKVYHLASWISFRADYQRAYRINVDGTRHLMEACRSGPVRKVVHVSSIAAGGVGIVEPDGLLRPRTEADSPEPLPDAYGRTKLEQERLVLAYGSDELQTVVVRPAAVFGPGDPAGINTLFWMIRKKRLPIYLGSSQTYVNLVFVGDVVRGLIAAMERGCAGEIYNLVGPNLTQRDLLQLVAQISGGSAPRFAVPAFMLMGAARLVDCMWRRVLHRPGPVHPSEVCNWTSPWLVSGAKAQSELGVEPTEMSQAIRETMTWLEEQKRRGLPPGWSPRREGGNQA